MIKVFTTKAFILFTLLFIVIAISSFIAFRETKEVCTGMKERTHTAPVKNNSEMLWDMFSTRLVSLISAG